MPPAAVAVCGPVVDRCPPTLARSPACIAPRADTPRKRPRLPPPACRRAPHRPRHWSLAPPPSRLGRFRPSELHIVLPGSPPRTGSGTGSRPQLWPWPWMSGWSRTRVETRPTRVPPPRQTPQGPTCWPSPTGRTATSQASRKDNDFHSSGRNRWCGSNEGVNRCPHQTTRHRLTKRETKGIFGGIMARPAWRPCAHGAHRCRRCLVGLTRPPAFRPTSRESR